MTDDNQPLLPLKDCAHIGVVVRDLEKAIDYYSKMFGWGPWERSADTNWPLGKAIKRGKPIAYQGRRAWLKLGPVTFEVGETRGDSVHTEFLESNGGGLHHLAFDIDDVEGAMAKLEEMGIPILQAGKDDEGKFRYAYFSTEEATGSNIIIEVRRKKK